MHLEILTHNQRDLLDLLADFADAYYLAGGTAIALYIGHRRSIDFDLFTEKSVHRMSIRNHIGKSVYPIEQVLYEEEGQLHIIVHAIKLTFYHFPYSIARETKLSNGLFIPSLLSLAAMKVLALGGRAKWKDYIDLFFLLHDHFSLKQICEQASLMFRDAFNEKLFREQLAYFKDIDFSEQVEYLAPDPGKNTIQEFLSDIATSRWHE